MKTSLRLFICLLVVLGISASRPATARERRVLYLSSYHTSYPSVFSQLEGIRSVLHDSEVLLDSEFMDSKRFARGTTRGLFLQTLTEKLAGLPTYDVVVAADDNAVRFFLEHRERLFPGLPMVFLGLNDLELAARMDLDPMVTGVVEAVSIKETLELMSSLLTNLKHVLIFSDETETCRSIRLLVEQVAANFTGLSFEYLNPMNFTQDELAARTSALGPDTAVLLLSAHVGAEGPSLGFVPGLQFIRSHINVPIFTLWDSPVGKGALGGLVISHFQQGRIAGEQARKILAGVSPSDLPVIMTSPNEYLFDFNELSLFGLEVDDLPAGARLINSPSSVIQRYRNTVVSVILVALGLLMVVLVLLALFRRQVRLRSALEASEARYRFLVDFAPDLMIEKDVSGLIRHVNDSFCEAFGKTRTEVVGTRHQPTVHEEDQALAPASLANLTTAGNVEQFQERCLTVRGWRWFSWRFRGVAGLDGALDSYLGLGRDITDEKAAVGQLAQSVQRLQDMFWNTPIAYQALSTGGEILSVNQAWLELTGYDQDSMVGRLFSELLVEEDRERYQEYLTNLMRNERPAVLEVSFVRKDGVVCRIEFSANVSQDVRALFGQIHCILRDVTEACAATERLRGSQEALVRLVAALQQSAEFILFTDNHGRFVFANDAYLSQSGYQLDELLGMDATELLADDNSPEFLQEVTSALKAGRIWRGHWITRRKDGTTYREGGSISPVRGGNGEIMGFVAVQRDTTHEQMLEEQLLQSRKLEAVGHLAGGIAHDFNNHLQAIIGYGILVKEGLGENSPQDDDLRSLLMAADRAEELVKRLLTFSRQAVVLPRRLQLEKVVSDLLKMLERLIGEHISLNISVKGELPLILADRAHMEQMVLNLVLNSRDAMAGGGTVNIRLGRVVFTDEVRHLRYPTRRGVFVMLSVSDTGRGIPEEIQPRIFDPFFTTKSSGGGTGMGLASVYGIVERHQGFLDFETVVGKGTTFNIYLPGLQEGGWDNAGVGFEEEEPTTRVSGTILIAEDEDMVRKLAVRVLTREGYEVIAARNGQEAMDLYEQHKSRVLMLVLDVVMPVLSGPEVYKQIIQEMPDIPVLFCSGYSGRSPESAQSILQEVPFLQKPFRPQDLVDSVNRILAREAH